MNSKYEYGDFLSIIERLRAEDGCPWDREQTHKSLKNCLIEESYEVLEGIDRLEASGDYSNLREELGDVFLQVVMHCQIAKEEGLFSMEDVIQEISEKMIRRHPHVFRDADIQNSEGVIKKWEEIKKEEKKDKQEEDTLKNIPKAFPALIRTGKVVKKAGKLYGYQNNTEEILNSLNCKIQEIKDLSKKEENEKIQESIGALLFDITKLANTHHIDAEEALNNVTDKFINQCENTPE